MTDEFSELLETSIYKEIASQAFYIAAGKKSSDPGALALMKELAAEELGHSRKLQKLKDQGLKASAWNPSNVPNLMISEYLTGGDSPEGASLQDLLIIAMKREQQAVEFYSNMMGAMRDASAKHLCESLVKWELSHKLRLELLYDGLFYKED